MKPQRPLGVVLSAIALGLAALVLVFFSLSGLAALLTGANLPSGTGGAAMPSAGAFTALMLFITLLYLILAGWATGTLVGLLRMRPWARISAMVIAGGLIGLGLLSAVAMMGMAAMVSAGSVPIPPNVPPALFHKLSIAIAVVSTILAILGIVWMVYLAQRRTREAFLHAQTLQALQAPQPPHAQGYPAPPAAPRWPIPQSQPALNPLTDFTVARPLASAHIQPSTPAMPPDTATPLPSAPYDPAAQQPWPTPPSPEQPHPDHFPARSPGHAPAHAPAPWPAYPGQLLHAASPVRSGRPVSITVVAMITLINAFFSLLGVVSTTPAFLFGVIVSGWPLHLYSVVWAAAAAIAGLGMLRLQRPAWLLAFALLGLSSLQFLAFVLPGPRARYVTYIASLQQHSLFGGAQPPLPSSMLSLTILMGMFLGLAVVVLFAILLWRARWAFTPAPQPPATEEPQAG